MNIYSNCCYCHCSTCSSDRLVFIPGLWTQYTVLFIQWEFRKKRNNLFFFSMVTNVIEKLSCLIYLQLQQYNKCELRKSHFDNLSGKSICGVENFSRGILEIYIHSYSTNTPYFTCEVQRMSTQSE